MMSLSNFRCGGTQILLRDSKDTIFLWKVVTPLLSEMISIHMEFRWSPHTRITMPLIVSISVNIPNVY
jgi:hypothetical protein